jgi:hypothetical protein
MTGPEPMFAALIAAEPTTVLPWQPVRDALADTRMHPLANGPSASPS